MGSKTKIFILYSDEDERLKNKLEEHLKNFRSQGWIADWYDHQAAPGNEKFSEVSARLADAGIVLFLISSAFMADDYCQVIMQQAMERHGAGVRVIPVILGPVHWKESPFGELQPLPRNRRPITTWPTRAAAFFDVADGILEAIKEISV